MSVLRRFNVLSQERIDVPAFRGLESAVASDFDTSIQTFATGPTAPYVMRGFNISMAGAIGGAASALQMIVADGALLHTQASQAGTFYLVPSGTPSQQLNSATNAIVSGAFTPSSINYVGVDYERFKDDTTSVQTYFWDPTSNTETTKNTPQAIVLRYRIFISTTTPGANILPIAIVVTDSGNNVVSITDCRPLFGRLGRGGFNGNPFYTYPWAQGRNENPSTSTSNSSDPFFGGDKAIGNVKDYLDALASEIKGVKGTTYWYSQSSSGSLESLRQDLGNTVITGRGTISHSATTAGLLNWSDDIRIQVIGSKLSYTLLANPTSTDITLTDGKVAYVTLVRGVVIAPNLIFTNGSAVVTSVGSIAWTTPLQPGDFVKVGSDTDAGYYAINTVDSSSQVTLTSAYTGTGTGIVGATSKYAFGKYQTSPTPSTNRNIYIANIENVPRGEDVFWLYLRSDNAGITPRIYIRFLGLDIEQGSSEDISDTVTKQLLQYIGSPMESASSPQYVSALNPGSVPEIQDLTFGAASAIAQNAYFFINSSGNSRTYYVWANKDAGGTDPVPPNRNTSIQVAITSGWTSSQVAAAYASAISAAVAGDFTAVQRPTPSIVRVTNVSAGACVSAADFNMGAPFAVSVVQSGTGTGNIVIEDGDSLTLAIKKLDAVIGSLNSALNDPSYDESISIVTSGATPPNSVNGPVTSGTNLGLPNNSRLGNAVQRYTVGKGILQLFLNGQYLRFGTDWAEVGVSGSSSNSVQILQGLVVGDVLQVRMSGLGSGGGGGGGGVGPQGPPGNTGPAGADAIGGPVAISTKNSSYTVSTADNVLLANCASGAIIFTLPTAASAVGHVFFFKKRDASTNSMTVQANGSEIIDGSNTQVSTTQYEAFTVVSDGTSWFLI